TESDLNNFGPRIGFAWAPFGDTKTSIRSAYGIFYNQSPGSHIQNIFQNSPPFGTRISLGPPPGPFDDPFLGNNPLPLPFPPPTDIVFPEHLFAATYPNKFRTSYLQSWHVTIEREVLPDWLVRVAYAGSKGTGLLQGWDLNAGIYVPGQSTPQNLSARRPYGPAFDTIWVADSVGGSNFNSLQVSLQRRFSRGFTIFANYT